MLDTCGEAENELTVELSQYKIFVERKIVNLLYDIAKIEIPKHLKPEETVH